MVERDSVELLPSRATRILSTRASHRRARRGGGGLALGRETGDGWIGYVETVVCYRRSPSANRPQVAAAVAFASVKDRGAQRYQNNPIGKSLGLF